MASVGMKSVSYNSLTIQTPHNISNNEWGSSSSELITYIVKDVSISIKKSSLVKEINAMRLHVMSLYGLDNFKFIWVTLANMFILRQDSVFLLRYIFTY